MSLLFLFNYTSTTEIYTLSLHDALPIFEHRRQDPLDLDARVQVLADHRQREPERSEEHTSELQSLTNLVCRLLLEKKKEEQYSILLGWQSSGYSAYNKTSTW